MTNADIATNPFYRQIPLSKGKYALVDAADYEFLSQWGWRCFERGTFYVYRSGYAGYINGKQKAKTIYMHRLILNAPDGMEVDHINGDGLCNIRSNLRLATKSQNNMNQRKTRGVSRFKGVARHKQCQKWQAGIKINGKRINLGLFVTETEAALAYNEAAVRLHGEFARLNITEG